MYLEKLGMFIGVATRKHTKVGQKYFKKGQTYVWGEKISGLGSRSARSHVIWPEPELEPEPFYLFFRIRSGNRSTFKN